MPKTTPPPPEKNNASRPEEARQPCPLCNGSGQLSSFKGVSRFLLSVEECPECAGLGYTVRENDPPSVKTDPARHRG